MERRFFGIHNAVVAMIHLQALPGTPHSRTRVREIIAHACEEAELYAQAGVDALLIENMNDRPYLRVVAGPEVVSVMTAAACEVRRRFPGPCGAHVLAGANEAALAVALGANLEFIRAEGFVFAHVADEGLMESCAGSLLRARKAWNAEHIKIFTDIKKKHSSHAITLDVSLAETAKAAEFFSSDGVIVTGATTGEPVSPIDLADVAEAAQIPVLIGSGATVSNIEALLGHANAVIVGSHFKRDGRWQEPVDAERVRVFVERVRSLA